MSTARGTKSVRCCSSAGFTLLSLADIGCREELPETDTLVGNARRVRASTTVWTGFADDTGLEVSASTERRACTSSYAGPATGHRQRGCRYGVYGVLPTARPGNPHGGGSAPTAQRTNFMGKCTGADGVDTRRRLLLRPRVCAPIWVRRTFAEMRVALRRPHQPIGRGRWRGCWLFECGVKIELESAVMGFAPPSLRLFVPLQPVLIFARYAKPLSYWHHRRQSAS
jgi:hypothetical protein